MASSKPPRVQSRWSWRVGSIAGIPIRVHLTLALLLVWIALAHTASGFGPTATIAGVLLVVVVFALIVVHELGHALVARHYGVATREILLLPIGGIASLESIPEDPRHELLIAIVGPAINVAIAGVLWAGIVLAGANPDARYATSLGEAFVAQLFWVNIALAAFNLIPAFPMDGGRALRAVLAMRTSRERATNVAAALGRGFAVVLGIAGFLFNPWLVLIALVVWMGASHEAQLVHLRAAIADIPASAAMNRRVDTVDASAPLGDAARLLVATGQGQLPIVDHGEMVGVLTRSDLAEGMARGGAFAPVLTAPHHEAVTVAPSEPLDHVLQQMTSRPDTVVIVVDEGMPVGVITADQLASFVALHEPSP